MIASKVHLVNCLMISLTSFFCVSIKAQNIQITHVYISSHQIDPSKKEQITHVVRADQAESLGLKKRRSKQFLLMLQNLNPLEQLEEIIIADYEYGFAKNTFYCNAKAFYGKRAQNFRMPRALEFHNSPFIAYDRFLNYHWLNKNWALYSGDEGPELVQMPDPIEVLHKNKQKYFDDLNCIKSELLNLDNSFKSETKKPLISVLENELSRKIYECKWQLVRYNVTHNRNNNPNISGIFEEFKFPKIELGFQEVLTIPEARRLWLYTDTLKKLNVMKSSVNKQTKCCFDRELYTIYLHNNLPENEAEVYVIKLSPALFYDLGNEVPSTNICVDFAEHFGLNTESKSDN